MAESAEQVIAFLRELASKARPYAERDLADMRAFAADSLGLADPQAWDWPHIGEQLRQARRLQRTGRQALLHRQGARRPVQHRRTLFEVKIRPDQAPVWHPGIQVLPSRARRPADRPVLPRPGRAGKRGGAWMDDVRARWLRQRPPADPRSRSWSAASPNRSATSPALLTHDDVITSVPRVRPTACTC